MFLFFPFFHFPCKFVIPRSVGSHQFPAHQNKQNVKPESLLFSRVLRDSTTCLVGPSVRPSVRHTLLFWRLWGLWLYRSCPNAPLTSNMALDHPHATGIAVYPALFFDPGFVSGRRAEASQMGRQLIGSYRSSALPSRDSHQQGRQHPNVGGVLKKPSNRKIVSSLSSYLWKSTANRDG